MSERSLPRKNTLIFTYNVDRFMNRDQSQPVSLNTEQPGISEDAQLSAPWLRVARAGWILLALVALGILITSQPGYALKITSGLPGHGPSTEPSTGYVYLQTINAVASLASSILSFCLAALLFRRKFENLAVVAISFYLLLYSIVMTGPLEAWGLYWLGNTDFAITVQTLIMATPTVALLVLFPSGRFIPSWSRWILIVSLPWNVIAILNPLVPSQEYDTTSLLILAISWIGLLGLGIYTQVYRYRRVSTLDERQQTKWVLFGFAIWFVYLLISTFPFIQLSNLPPGTPQPWWSPLSELGWWLSLNIVPVTLAIAITRSRLWNIDLVINRALVYGALTFATMALYFVLVGGLGSLLHVGNNSFIAFLTTGLVAILFNPLRSRLQHSINRLMYGDRDDPVAVLSKLGEQLKHTGSPDDALSGITETVAQTLKLPYVAIELGENSEIAASFGIPKSEVIRLPLYYQTETNGYLVVALRSPGESFSASERQLLENIAHQAGAAAHNARLTVDLLRARQRLIAAREEERRRIRRDLHDGLGPQLASQALTLDAIARLIDSDPKTAKALLADLKSQSQAAITDIRRLIYDLRPPALDDLGLVTALREEFARMELNGLKIHLHAPKQLPSLPAAVELAAYRIVQEAVNNVVKHAGAKSCQARLEMQKDALIVEVVDDGRGVSPEAHPGVGLHSMRERAEELGGRLEIGSAPGGGTQIIARLPVEASQDN
jgi:signal transduction histidine kinase